MTTAESGVTVNEIITERNLANREAAQAELA
jgi:hypothetical protein